LGLISWASAAGTPNGGKPGFSLPPTSCSDRKDIALIQIKSGSFSSFSGRRLRVRPVRAEPFLPRELAGGGLDGVGFLR
jgi:hypothetical protein